MARSRHIRARTQRDNGRIRSAPRLRAGASDRRQVTVSNLPQRTCFRRWLGHDTLWQRATRSRPDFLARRICCVCRGKRRPEIAQVHDSRGKKRPHYRDRLLAVFDRPVGRYRGDIKLSCDCYNRRLLATTGAGGMAPRDHLPNRIRPHETFHPLGRRCDCNGHSVHHHSFRSNGS